MCFSFWLIQHTAAPWRHLKAFSANWKFREFPRKSCQRAASNVARVCGLLALLWIKVTNLATFLDSTFYTGIQCDQICGSSELLWSERAESGYSASFTFFLLFWLATWRYAGSMGSRGYLKLPELRVANLAFWRPNLTNVTLLGRNLASIFKRLHEVPL